MEVAQAAFVRSRPLREDGPQLGSDAWRLDVTSPIDGRVLRVLRESEGLVDAGAEIVEGGDMGDLEAMIDLVSEDAVKVKPGQACEISGWGGEGRSPAAVATGRRRCSPDSPAVSR